MPTPPPEFTPTRRDEIIMHGLTEEQREHYIRLRIEGRLEGGAQIAVTRKGPAGYVRNTKHYGPMGNRVSSQAEVDKAALALEKQGMEVRPMKEVAREQRKSLHKKPKSEMTGEQKETLNKLIKEETR